MTRTPRFLRVRPWAGPWVRTLSLALAVLVRIGLIKTIAW